MKRDFRLTKPEQYKSVYNKGCTQTDRFLVLKAAPNGLEYSRYGFSVSKRIGNAVVRNRVKRILREILRQVPLRQGWDIVIIARKPSSDSDFRQFQKSALDLLARCRIIAK